MCICSAALLMKQRCNIKTERDTDQAARSYSPQIRTNSSKWCGPKMDESLVRYSKLSMITATNRFSIWTEDKHSHLFVWKEMEYNIQIWMSPDRKWDENTSFLVLPGMSWKRWTRQSRSRQSQIRSLLLDQMLVLLGPSRTVVPPDMTAWSPAMIPLWRSWTDTHTCTWPRGSSTAYSCLLPSGRCNPSINTALKWSNCGRTKLCLQSV